MLVHCIKIRVKVTGKDSQRIEVSHHNIILINNNMAADINFKVEGPNCNHFPGRTVFHLYALKTLKIQLSVSL